MRNQRSWRILTEVEINTTTLQVSKVIGKVDENGNSFYPLFTAPTTVVFMSDDKKTFETCKATADGQGNMTLTKRGLSDDKSETEVANFKQDWLPGTYMFATMAAGDLPSLNEDNTWGGDQNFNGEVNVDGDFNVTGDFSMNSGGDIDIKTDTGTVVFKDKDVGPVTLSQMVRPAQGGSAIELMSEADFQQINPDVNTGYLRYNTDDVITKVYFNGCDCNFGGIADIHNQTEKCCIEADDEIVIADSVDSYGNKKAKFKNVYKNIFSDLGDGSDGDCIINTDTQLCAKNWNFCNLTICSGSVLSFCGDDIPVIRVKGDFCNDGMICLQNRFLGQSVAKIVLPNGIVKTVCNVCNNVGATVCELGGCGGTSWWAAGGDGGKMGENGCDGSGCCGVGGTGTEYAGGGGGGGGRYAGICQGCNGGNASGCTGGDGGSGGYCYGGGGGGGFGLCQGGNGGSIQGTYCPTAGGDGGNSYCRGGNGGNSSSGCNPTTQCISGGKGGDGCCYGGNGGNVIYGDRGGKGGDGGIGIYCKGGNGGCGGCMCSDQDANHKHYGRKGGDGGDSFYGCGGKGGNGGESRWRAQGGDGGNGGYGYIAGGDGGMGGTDWCGYYGAGSGGKGGNSYLQGGNGGAAGNKYRYDPSQSQCGLGKGGDGGDSVMGMYSLVVFASNIKVGNICGNGGNGGNGGAASAWGCSNFENLSNDIYAGKGGNGGDGGSVYFYYKCNGEYGSGCTICVNGGLGGLGGIGSNGRGKPGKDGKDGEVILTNLYVN